MSFFSKVKISCFATMDCEIMRWMTGKTLSIAKTGFLASIERSIFCTEKRKRYFFLC